MTDVRGQTRPAMSGSWKSAFILTTAVMTYSARASHFLPSHPWAMSGLGLTGGVFTGIFALAASSTTVKAVGPSASDEIARIAARKIQISFVRQVDKSDNGIIEPSPTDLNRVLGSFNAGVKTTEERDFQFGQALSITQTILLNIIVQTVSAAIDEEKVKAAIAEQAPSMDRHYGIYGCPPRQPGAPPSSTTITARQMAQELSGSSHPIRMARIGVSPASRLRTARSPLSHSSRKTSLRGRPKNSPRPSTRTSRSFIAGDFTPRARRPKSSRSWPRAPPILETHGI